MSRGSMEIVLASGSADVADNAVVLPLMESVSTVTYRFVSLADGSVRTVWNPRRRGRFGGGTGSGRD
jgi:hypothetical protein